MFKGNWGLRTNRPKGIRWLRFEAILVCWHRKPKPPSRERAVECRYQSRSRGPSLEPTLRFVVVILERLFLLLLCAQTVTKTGK